MKQVYPPPTCDICAGVDCDPGQGKYGKIHPQCTVTDCTTYLDLEESLDCGVCVFCRKEKRWRDEAVWNRLYADEFGEYDEEAWE